METLGPVLCQSLMRNIGGNALRSELDRLSEPLKRLVARYPGAKVWIEAALHDEHFPSPRVTPEQKTMFIKKIIRYGPKYIEYTGRLDYIVTNIQYQSPRLASNQSGCSGVLGNR